MRKELTLASAVLAAALSSCAMPGSDDMKLSSQIERKMQSDSALGPDALRVQAADRVVYLNGCVDNWMEYYKAEAVARSVPGVAAVVNDLELRGTRG